MTRWQWIAIATAFAALTAATMALRWAEHPDSAALLGGSEAEAADLFQKYLIERPREPVQAEPFTAMSVRSAPPGLSDYAGRYILLNFWATWCEPCKKEMPELEALYEGLKDRNLVVLAVSMEETADKVGKFLESNPFKFPVLADPDGEVARLYGVDSIPLTYLITPGGAIEGRALGPRNWNDPPLRAYFSKAAEPTGR
jgi:peroxiredoxin